MGLLFVGGTFWQLSGRERVYRAVMWCEPVGTVRTFLAELDRGEPARAAELADLVLTHRNAPRAFAALGPKWRRLGPDGRARRMREEIRRRAGRPARAAPAGDLLDAYRTLGLETDASTGEVKRAYRALARTHHPDAGRVPDDERMKAVNRAYERILSARGKGRVGREA